MGVVAALAGGPTGRLPEVTAQLDSMSATLTSVNADMTHLREALAESRLWGDEHLATLRRDNTELRAMLTGEFARLAANQQMILQSLAEMQAKIDAQQASLAATVASTVRTTVQEELPAALAPTVNKAFASAFREGLVPAFEAAMRDMFTQVHQTFATGLAEHLSAAAGLSVATADRVERAVGRLEALERPAQPSAAAVLPAAKAAAGMALASDSLPSSSAGGTASVATDAAKEAPPSIVAVPAAAPTPSPPGPSKPSNGQSAADSPDQLSGQAANASPPEVYEQIKALLGAQDYVQSFTLGLEQSDPVLVNWICQQLPPSAACSDKGTSLLNEILLLSLMQQLSVSIDSAPAAELRRQLDWIEHACKNLDPETSQYAANLVGILHEVNEAIKAVSKGASDRATAHMAAMTGRIVNSKLRAAES